MSRTKLVTRLVGNMLIVIGMMKNVDATMKDKIGRTAATQLVIQHINPQLKPPGVNQGKKGTESVQKVQSQEQVVATKTQRDVHVTASMKNIQIVAIQAARE